MLKREKNARIKGAAFTQIFLLIIATIAFAFVLGEASVVKGWGVGDHVELGDSVWTKGADGRWTTPDSAASWSDYAVDNELSLAAAGPQAVGPAALANPADAGGVDALLDEVAGSGLADVAKPIASEVPLDWGAGLNTLKAGLGWALGIAGAIMLIGQFAGMQESQTMALAAAAAAGIMAGHLTYSILELAPGKDTFFWGLTKGGAAWTGVGVGIVIGAVILLTMYKKENTKTFKFTCEPWEAPLGGKKCEQCNMDSKFRPCTEYRCKALGQACQLLNKETPGKEMCVWVNPKDVNSATIDFWADVLKPTGLSHEPDKPLRPDARGVRIFKAGATNGCLDAFTPLEFGVITNEPAQCRIDYNHTAKFDDMTFFVGGTNLFEYNHTEKMKLPGPDAFNSSAGGAPMFQNDGTMNLFIRCMDANGNQNVDEYTIRFCVDKSPDTTPPRIEGSSIPTGSAVQFDVKSVPIEVYANEPAECKWSQVDGTEFDLMENTMTCATDGSQINTLLSYTCSGNLTGMKNNGDNKYYFKCRDKPGKPLNERNTNQQNAYELNLRGSQPLNIISVSPNGTVRGSTVPVQVDLGAQTANGADEGRAFCYFSPLVESINASYIQMFETNDYKHKQTLFLTTGTYTYYFRCIDSGGNSVVSNTTFDVFSDQTAPVVTRVYKDETGLKVVTNEDAECVYSLTDCNYKFDEGLKMFYQSPSMKKNSYAEWKTNAVYYIKCRDLYGNEPNPNECSVVAGAIDLTGTSSSAAV